VSTSKIAGLIGRRNHAATLRSKNDNRLSEAFVIPPRHNARRISGIRSTHGYSTRWTTSPFASARPAIYSSDPSCPAPSLEPSPWRRAPTLSGFGWRASSLAASLASSFYRAVSAKGARCERRTTSGPRKGCPFTSPSFPPAVTQSAARPGRRPRLSRSYALCRRHYARCTRREALGGVGGRPISHARLEVRP
jgi:hypothetical protein